MKSVSDGSAVRVLPVLWTSQGQFFIDLRLREFRRTVNPHERIEFSSDRGRQLCRQANIVSCSRCKISFIVPGHLTDGILVCMDCGDVICDDI